MALAGTVLGREVVDGMEHLALAVSTGSSSPAGSSGAPVVVDGAVVGILARSNPDGTNWYAAGHDSRRQSASGSRHRRCRHTDCWRGQRCAERDRSPGPRDEIDTLSALVASRSTKTPMSIGLFGNWGSGKSFFMQKMDERIRVFRDSAAGDPESPYCKSIIQLWFNAWHYIDQSLWASLGAEIFEGLAHGLTEVETKKDGPQLEDQRTTLLVKGRTRKRNARRLRRCWRNRRRISTCTGARSPASNPRPIVRSNAPWATKRSSKRSWRWLRPKRK